MKKDYLEEGAMADTADLVVLGAYYGTGNKGNHFVCINYSMYEYGLYLLVKWRVISS